MYIPGPRSMTKYQKRQNMKEDKKGNEPTKTIKEPVKKGKRTDRKWKIVSQKGKGRQHIHTIILCVYNIYTLSLYCTVYIYTIYTVFIYHVSRWHVIYTFYTHTHEHEKMQVNSKTKEGQERSLTGEEWKKDQV